MYIYVYTHESMFLSIIYFCVDRYTCIYTYMYIHYIYIYMYIYMYLYTWIGRYINTI